MPKLGLVAGDKSLPSHVIAFAKRTGTPLVIAGVKGAYTNPVDISVKLSELSRLVRFFQQSGVTHVVLVGGIHRAKIGFSLGLIAFFARLLFIKNKQDGAIRLVLGAFEKVGIEPVGIQDLMPELLVEKGVLTHAQPSQGDLQNIEKSTPAARNFAATDRGQSSVIVDGKLTSTERWAGTDDLIRRNAGKGAVLMKFAKPQQDMRADIPIIGPHTIKSLSEAGFKGAAIESGKTIIENRDETLAAANQAGIWLVGV